MDSQVRLPISHPVRVKARDVKVLEREEVVSRMTGQISARCPCNICMGEVHSRRRWDMVKKHLHDVVRYPFLRGRTRVMLYSTESNALSSFYTLHVLHIY